MVEAPITKQTEFTLKRITVNLNTLNNIRLEDFVSTNTKRFILITSISLKFMERKVEDWNKNVEYINIKETLKSFKVVNDAADIVPYTRIQFNSYS